VSLGGANEQIHAAFLKGWRSAVEHDAASMHIAALERRILAVATLCAEAAKGVGAGEDGNLVDPTKILAALKLPPISTVRDQVIAEIRARVVALDPDSPTLKILDELEKGKP
jgi:hypothetical protein